MNGGSDNRWEWLSCGPGDGGAVTVGPSTNGTCGGFGRRVRDRVGAVTGQMYEVGSRGTSETHTSPSVPSPGVPETRGPSTVRVLIRGTPLLTTRPRGGAQIVGRSLIRRVGPWSRNTSDYLKTPV